MLLTVFSTKGGIMAKTGYNVAAKDAIVCAALDARKGGMVWEKAFAAAKRAGFSGALSTLKRWVDEAKLNSIPRGNAAGGANVPAKSLQNSKLTQAASWEQIENKFPVLREGKKYERLISLFDGPFFNPRPGEILAWSYISEKKEALCVTNSHGSDPRGADVVVDNTINPNGATLTVVMNSAAGGAHPVGSRLPVQHRWDGTAFVSIRGVVPGQKLVLVNGN